MKNNGAGISFEGQTAVVTGSTRGIGRAIAQALADLGARVIITGTRTQPAKKIPAGQEYWPLDLTDDKSVKDFCKRLEALKRLDILVNNAGINKIEPVDELTSENWDNILKVNLTGAMLLTRSAARVMKRGKGGRILNVSSIFGVVSRTQRHAYSASKFGLNGLTKSSALDLAPFNIQVNAICPGFVLTDLTRGILSRKDITELNLQIPLGRFANEEEIAKVAVFLCSGWNTYMTGETVVVDGGFVSR